jgi:hypothetical protein
MAHLWLETSFRSMHREVKLISAAIGTALPSHHRPTIIAASTPNPNWTVPNGADVVSARSGKYPRARVRAFAAIRLRNSTYLNNGTTILKKPPRPIHTRTSRSRRANAAMRLKDALVHHMTGTQGIDLTGWC